MNIKELESTYKIRFRQNIFDSKELIIDYGNKQRKLYITELSTIPFIDPDKDVSLQTNFLPLLDKKNVLCIEEIIYLSYDEIIENYTNLSIDSLLYTNPPKMDDVKSYILLDKKYIDIENDIKINLNYKTHIYMAFDFFDKLDNGSITLYLDQGIFIIHFTKSKKTCEFEVVEHKLSLISESKIIYSEEFDIKETDSLVSICKYMILQSVVYINPALAILNEINFANKKKNF